MKVLFIGHYREQSGWGRAACEYILALDEVGVDVVCRAVKLNDIQAEIPERIKELENKSTDGAEICIQCLLPHQLHYNGNFKRNICIPFIDTIELDRHPWISQMENFEIWSPCVSLDAAIEDIKEYEDESCREINRAAIVPVPCDPSKYLSTQTPLDIGVDLSGKFIFYSIFDLTPRKNMLGLLKAFHTAFEPWEDVALIIKTGKFGKPADEVRSVCIDMNKKICQSLKLYPEGEYNNPIFITEQLTDEQIEQLHVLGDCFVLPTFGEAWCFPAFDAMGYGNKPIVTKNTSCDDYITDTTGTLCKSVPQPVSGMTDTFSEIFNGHEIWHEPSIIDFARSMRGMYEDRYVPIPKNNPQNGYERTMDFSRTVVGNKMKELLNV